MTLAASLVSLFEHLTQRRRWQLMGLFFLMLVNALAEMATIGALVPFLGLLVNPSAANKYPLLETILLWFGAEDGNILFVACTLFCMSTICAAMIRMLMMWGSMRFSYSLGAEIGGEVYLRTLHQSYSWHVSQNSSEVLAGIQKVDVVIGAILSPILQGVVALVITVGILVILIAIDFQSAAIASVSFTIMYGFNTFVLRNKVKCNSQTISVNMSRRVQSIQEGLGGIRDVLLDGTQSVYYSKFVDIDHAMRRAQASNALAATFPRYIIEGVGMMLIVILAYWLSLQQGGLTAAIPLLGALAIGAQKLLPQMQIVYAAWSSINGSFNLLEDVLGLLIKPIAPENSKSIPSTENTKINKIEYSKVVAPHHQQPLIILRNVSFRYKADAPEVLHNINIEISQGSRIGFIGKSGSGKSTLIDLIMGLLEPTSGRIEIDGTPLNKNNLRAWQLRIAHVPQAIYLSDATIAENIALGIPKDQIDLSRVKAASLKAQLSDFIQNQPLKYNTCVGERGLRLSGGQRQRIGLARALYKQANILVLDEATSALDHTTEKSVMLDIKALGNELTVLIIAHRVSTLRNCDKIIELGNTSVQRVGNYETLIGS
jgi:ATP-binding cassette subfamily B protein